MISTEIDDLRIVLGNDNGTKIFSIGPIHDLGCTSPLNHNKSSAKIKLENGEIVTFYHSGQLDCRKFGLDGIISPTDYTKLMESPIKTIRLQGTERYHDYDFIVYKDILIDKLKCINRKRDGKYNTLTIPRNMATYIPLLLSKSLYL